MESEYTRKEKEKCWEGSFFRVIRFGENIYEFLREVNRQERGRTSVGRGMFVVL